MISKIEHPISILFHFVMYLHNIYYIMHFVVFCFCVFPLFFYFFGIALQHFSTVRTIRHELHGVAFQFSLHFFFNTNTLGCVAVSPSSGSFYFRCTITFLLLFLNFSRPNHLWNIMYTYKYIVHNLISLIRWSSKTRT